MKDDLFNRITSKYKTMPELMQGVSVATTKAQVDYWNKQKDRTFNYIESIKQAMESINAMYYVGDLELDDYIESSNALTSELNYISTGMRVVDITAHLDCRNRKK